MDFNKEQLEVINTISGNLAVIATAGSGKTTVLTNRIKNMVDHQVNPENILAITFSKKAKDNIEEKLPQLGIYGVNVDTFHSLALKIIMSAYGRKYTVWTAQWEKEKVLTDICCKKLSLCKRDDLPYNNIMRFFSLQKTNNLSPSDQLVFPKDIPFEKSDMIQVYGEYEKYKEENSYIEFDDFMNMANDILSNNHDILQHFRNKFQYILSDEFQDVSNSQSVLLKKLNDTNTMIVGDPLQAIYSFRGGNSTYIMNFDKNYANTKVVNLNKNYRCSQDIVSLANELANHIPDSKTEHYVESAATNGHVMVPEYRTFLSEYEENKWIIKKIGEKQNKGYEAKDIAVLTRTNAQLTKLQAGLRKEKIAYDVVNGTDFTELPEIKLLISYLKLALYDNDNEAFSYLYNKPLRWLDQKFLEEVKENSMKRNVSYYHSMMTIDRRNWRFKNGIEEIYDVINTLQNKRYENVGCMIRYLRSRLEIDKFASKGKVSDDGGSTEQTENMDAFENIAEQYDSLPEFVEYLNNGNKDTFKGKNTIHLSTIHKAKGLEYPIVFLPGLNNGLLPHSKSDDIQDERRLFYVGITRAEKELYISSSNFYNNKLNEVSPFIKDIKQKMKIITEKQN